MTDEQMSEGSKHYEGLYHRNIELLREVEELKKQLAATLRDQIAIAALSSLIAHQGPGQLKVTSDDRSMRAYEYADAMLKARGE